jgi:hypothetical protein
MPAPTLVVQTTYAELLERCAAASFSDAFPEDGTFTCKTIKGRRYWYFQVRTAEGRTQRYVGPESAALLERIGAHKQARDDERERRALVSTLVRSFSLPAPLPRIGGVVSTLAKVGIFRLRSVLIGTVAYQSYPAMLGVRVPGALLQTSDVDIAQFRNVSVSVVDRTPPMLDVLKEADRTFKEIPRISHHQGATSYMAKGGLRVDFVTPNEGPDTDRPQNLPALQTDAQPLRFLDFLIHEAEHAVVLHGPGIYVRVPAPERYAVHKLILATRRPTGIAKRDKDLHQAEVLIEALTDKRPEALKQVWEEAYGRGKRWRASLLMGMSQLTPAIRDLLLRTLGRTREIIPNIDLTFSSSPVRYDSHRDLVQFVGEALGNPVQCGVSRDALEDHFGSDQLDRTGRIEAFRKNRSQIEQLLRRKYLSWPVEETEGVLLTTMDLKNLGSLGNGDRQQE